MPRLNECPYCRAPIFKQKKYSKTRCATCNQLLPPLKSAGVLVTIIFIIILALAAAGVGVYFFVVQPMLVEKEYKQALDDKNWSKVYDLIEDTDNDDWQEEADAAIIEEAQGYYDDCISGKLDYDKASSKLDKIKKYNSEIKKMMEKLEAWNEANQYIENGDWYRSNGNNKDAVNEYAKVSCKQPDLYRTAMNNIEACMNYMTGDDSMKVWYDNFLKNSVYDLEDNALANPSDAEAQALYIEIRDKYEAILSAYARSTSADGLQNSRRLALDPVVAYANGRDNMDFSADLQSAIDNILDPWWSNDILPAVERGNNIVAVYEALRVNQTYFVLNSSYEAKFVNAVSAAEERLYDWFRGSLITAKSDGTWNQMQQDYNTIVAILADYPDVVSTLRTIYDQNKP